MSSLLCMCILLQSNKAKQLWLTMDLEDHVTECCEWAEVMIIPPTFSIRFMTLLTSRAHCNVPTYIYPFYAVCLAVLLGLLE